MRAFQQVDVFGAEPLAGNPVAVVLGAEGLTGAQMQSLARWTNLSETTFVLPPTVPDANYRVRIFTPSEELPFAGHPTLGTCHAWLRAGGESGEEVVQECGVGLVTIRRGAHLAFAAPELLRSGPVDQADLLRVAAALRLRIEDIVDAQWVDNGPGWVAVLLPSAQAVLEVQPGLLDGYFIGVAGPRPDGELEVRAFFDVDGLTAEDPVTGSLNASLAPWLVDSGQLEFPYVARQGQKVGADGVVHLSRDADGTVWVAGRTVTIVDGELDLS